MSEPTNITEPAALVDTLETGRANKVKREINKLISTVNSSTFDIAELLFEVQSKQYFTGYGFESFSKFSKSLNIKYTKAFYLVAIVKLMTSCGFARAEYEPVGIAKLRLISRLDYEGEFNGTPMPIVIRELVLKAPLLSTEEVKLEVDTILGLTEDESMVWLNVHLKKLARDNTVKVALNLMKRHIPQTDGDDGLKKDASDGAALEMICANFLADPNWAIDDNPETVVEQNETEEETDEPVEGGV